MWSADSNYEVSLGCEDWPTITKIHLFTTAHPMVKRGKNSYCERCRNGVWVCDTPHPTTASSLSPHCRLSSPTPPYPPGPPYTTKLPCPLHAHPHPKTKRLPKGPSHQRRDLSPVSFFRARTLCPSATPFSCLNIQRYKIKIKKYYLMQGVFHNFFFQLQVHTSVSTKH